MASMARHLSIGWLLVLTYSVSGTINHSLQLAMHEVSHDLWFKTKWKNTAMGYIANLPTCVASASTFKRYHLEHHSGQGVEGVDVDIPSKLEHQLFYSTLGKMIWVMFTPIFYSFRPMIIRPKAMSIPELLNWVVILISDFTVLHFFGVQGFFYLIFGSFFGMGLHPMTGHFISEHAEFIPGQETYSYYGPLNYLTYNVGYHNEHHDFPRVPGRLLPRVKAIAPEFYNMPCYHSWSRVVWDFIFTPQVGFLNRVKRKEA
jgi:sphingolipid delta-4 desaturase